MKKYTFQVWVEVRGRNHVKAYENLRRKLLPLVGWEDTDTAFEVLENGSWGAPVSEEDVQAARQVYRHGDEGQRTCRDDECDHGLIVGGIPICMMTAKELRKLPHQMNRLRARLERLGIPESDDD